MTHSFLFKWPIFLELVQVRTVPKSKHTLAAAQEKIIIIIIICPEYETATTKTVGQTDSRAGQ